MRAILVISLELPEPESITEVVSHIDPPNVPHFGGMVRIAVDPVASTVEHWLDE